MFFSWFLMLPPEPFLYRCTLATMVPAAPQQSFGHGVWDWKPRWPRFQVTQHCLKNCLVGWVVGWLANKKPSMVRLVRLVGWPGLQVVVRLVAWFVCSFICWKHLLWEMLNPNVHVSGESVHLSSTANHLCRWLVNWLAINFQTPSWRSIMALLFGRGMAFRVILPLQQNWVDQTDNHSQLFGVSKWYSIFLHLVSTWRPTPLSSTCFHVMYSC